MNSEEFIEKSKDMIVEFYNTMIDFTGEYPLTYDSINVLFFTCFGKDCFVGLMDTFFDTNLIFQVSFRGDCFCFDVFNKCSHQEYVLG